MDTVVREPTNFTFRVISTIIDQHIYHLYPPFVLPLNNHYIDHFPPPETPSTSWAGTASTSVGDEAGSPGSECFQPSGLANDGGLNAAKMAVETQRKEVLT